MSLYVKGVADGARLCKRYRDASRHHGLSLLRRKSVNAVQSSVPTQNVARLRQRCHHGICKTAQRGGGWTRCPQGLLWSLDLHPWIFSARQCGGHTRVAGGSWG